MKSCVLRHIVLCSPVRNNEISEKYARLLHPSAIEINLVCSTEMSVDLHATTLLSIPAGTITLFVDTVVTTLKLINWSFVGICVVVFQRITGWSRLIRLMNLMKRLHYTNLHYYKLLLLLLYLKCSKWVWERSWLRHYAASRMVTRSNIDVTGFFSWPNIFSRIMALG
jgi:hypothetical protein